MKRKTLPYTLSLLTLILTACTGLNTLPTLVPTHTPIPTHTPTSIPTWTPSPTPPPTATPTPLPSPTPTATPLFGPGTPTPESAGWLTQRWNSASPDGRWFADVVVRLPLVAQEAVDEVAHTEVVISRSDGGLRWVVLDEWTPYGLGFPTPQDFRWTKDALYFSLRAIPDGCSLFGWEVALLHFDLREGMLSQVASELPGAPQLAPDYGRLAYLNEETLVIRDLESGTERRVPFAPEGASWQAGNLVWSPSGRQVAFTVVQSACVGAAAERSIWVVDTEQFNSTRVLSPDERRLQLFTWAGDEALLLTDPLGEAWRLNLTTLNLAPVR